MRSTEPCSKRTFMTLRLYSAPLAPRAARPPSARPPVALLKAPYGSFAFIAATAVEALPSLLLLQQLLLLLLLARAPPIAVDDLNRCDAWISAGTIPPLLPWLLLLARAPPTAVEARSSCGKPAALVGQLAFPATMRRTRLKMPVALARPAEESGLVPGREDIRRDDGELISMLPLIGS